MNPLRSILVPTVLILAGTSLGCGGAKTVEVVSPRRGEIRESFTEPAKTRLEKTRVIAMPVDGRIAHVDVEPGDQVSEGKELVVFDREPLEQEVSEAAEAVAELEAQLAVKEDSSLEQVALEEAEAAVVAAGESLKAAEAQVAAEQARHEHALKERARSETLFESGQTAASEFDEKKLQAETALIELRKQEFTVAALKAIIVAVRLGPRAINEYLSKKKLERLVIVKQHLQAKARLARAKYRLKLAAVTSPIRGLVLEKYEEGGTFLAAGVPLLLVGNLDELEAEADVLTQDVLALPENARVELTSARGLDPIAGRVRLVEPAGFTKLSSLGVEQQRVKVIIALDQKSDKLGVGYRLQARFFTASKENALVVPRYSVLQDVDGAYYVLKIAGRRLVKQVVTLGLQSDLELEITQGLSESDSIVAAPDTTMDEGDAVKIKP